MYMYMYIHVYRNNNETLCLIAIVHVGKHAILIRFRTVIISKECLLDTLAVAPAEKKFEWH